MGCTHVAWRLAGSMVGGTGYVVRLVSAGVVALMVFRMMVMVMTAVPVMAAAVRAFGMVRRVGSGGRMRRFNWLCGLLRSDVPVHVQAEMLDKPIVLRLGRAALRRGCGRGSVVVGHPGIPCLGRDEVPVVGMRQRADKGPRWLPPV